MFRRPMGRRSLGSRRASAVHKLGELLATPTRRAWAREVPLAGLTEQETLVLRWLMNRTTSAEPAIAAGMWQAGN